jgi:hypothetical protein
MKVIALSAQPQPLFPSGMLREAKTLVPSLSYCKESFPGSFNHVQSY